MIFHKLSRALRLVSSPTFHGTLRVILAMAIISCAGLNGHVAHAENRAEAVEAIFAEFGNESDPGVSVLVMEGDVVRHRFHKGLADVGTASPITDEAVFNIGSISKQFTVFGILLLRDEGKLSLADDVRTFIPDLPAYGRPITLEQLARHTSGLRSQNYASLMGTWTQADERTHAQMLDLIRRQPALMFEPGSEFSYSNAGTALLAEVITRVSGEPYQAFMKRRVYDPLGMTSTFNRVEAAQVIANEVHSYYRENGILMKAINPSGVQGYTNVYSTALDLAKWADNLKTGKVGGVQTVGELMSATKLPEGRSTEHRMGLYSTPYRGYRQFQHTGSDRAYTSYLGWFPDIDLKIVILANIEGIDVFRSAYTIADLYLPEGTGPLGVNPPLSSMESEVHPLGDDDLAKYAGTFWSDELGDIRQIDLADGQLRYVRSEENFSPLMPVGRGRFQLTDAASPAFVTITEQDMVFEDSDGPLRFERIAAQTEPSSMPVDLEGIYVSDEISATYRLRVCDGKIVLTHAKQGTLLFSPVAPQIYRSDAWFLRSIRLVPDEAGRILGFQASNVGVTDVRFAKVPSSFLAEPRYEICKQVNSELPK